MAFTCRWTANGDGTHNFGTGGNWHGAAAPGTTDSFLVALGTRGCEITAGMAQGALDPTHMSVGDEFKGVIGDPAAPLVIGAATLITINAPEAKTICIQTVADHTVTDLIVYASGVEAYSLWLNSGHASSAPFTNVWLLGNGLVHFASAVDIDNLYVAGGNLVITAQGNIEYMYATGGKIINHATLGTVEVSAGALLDHRGSGTEGNATKITGYKGATVLLNCRNGTISDLIAYAGSYFDGTRVGYENTLSAGEIHKGAVVKLNENWDVNANVLKKGGIYIGPSGPTQDIDPQPL